MVGTGGIGSGSFFLMEGSETLGREESRGGRLLDRRDYCKLHIISHYVRALLGESFPVTPIGSVGDDEPGRRLLEEMRQAGLDLACVRVDPERPTLSSFCLLYPDGSGGNLTTTDSASAAVDPEAIAAAEGVAAGLGHGGVALAAPEVPLAARAALLDLATRHGLLRVAAFTRAELAAGACDALLAQADLVALNLEEARAAAEAAPGTHARAAGSDAPSPGARATVEAIARRFPRLRLSVTDGARGSWSWAPGEPGDGARLVHDPAVPVAVASAAGAGDAHLAAVIAGMALGLPLAGAQQLGTIVAAASVLSPHTIHPGLSRELLRSVALNRAGWMPEVMALIE